MINKGIKYEEFDAKTARPIPVIILADTSGSMSVDGKILVITVLGEAT